VDGDNGSIEYQFKTHLGLSEDEMEELNTVDWYELFAHDQILSGETLVESVPATDGTMGHTVLGADLPQTPGEPIDLAALAGENTEVDGNVLKATVSGEPVLNGEKVEVAEIMEVPDDVDFATGNIRFPGSVEVKGGVRPGFTIEVRDNLTVGGSVEGAHLAAASDITITAGFLGESDGREGALLAGGDIQVKYLQAGNVTAGGDLLVGEDIVRSNVGVLGKITVGGRGRIVGGRVSAGTAIHAKSIGAPTGVRTIVAVGNPGSEAKTVEALLEARVLSQMAEDGATPDLEEVGEAEAAAAAEAGDEGEQEDDVRPRAWWSAARSTKELWSESDRWRWWWIAGSITARCVNPRGESRSSRCRIAETGTDPTIGRLSTHPWDAVITYAASATVHREVGRLDRGDDPRVKGAIGQI